MSLKSSSSFPDGPPSNLVAGVLLLGLIGFWLRSGLSDEVADIQRGFRLSPPFTLLVILSFTLVYFACQIFLAFPVAEFGTRRAVSIGFIVCAFGATGTALASSLTGHMVSRAALALGLAVAVIARCAIFAGLPESRRGTFNSLFEACSQASALLPTAFAAALLTPAGWRWRMGVGAVGAAILAVAWLRLDSSIQRRSWVYRETPSLRSRVAIGCYLAYAAYIYCVQGYVTLMPMLLGDTKAPIAGRAAMGRYGMSVLVLAALFSGWLSDRLVGGNAAQVLQVRKRFVIWGLLLATFGIGITFIANVTLIYTLIFLSFVGLGVVTPNLWALLQRAAPPGAAPMWAGIQGYFGGVAGFIGPLVAGFVANRLGLSAAARLPAVVAVLAAFTTAWLIRPTDVDRGWAYYAGIQEGAPEIMHIEEALIVQRNRAFWRSFAWVVAWTIGLLLVLSGINSTLALAVNFFLGGGVSFTVPLAIGYYLYIKYSQGPGVILWFRRFNAGRERSRLDLWLNRAARGLGATVSIQDSSFRYSYLMSPRRLFLLYFAWSAITGACFYGTTLIEGPMWTALGIKSDRPSFSVILPAAIFGGSVWAAVLYLRRGSYFRLKKNGWPGAIDKILRKIADRKVVPYSVVLIQCADSFWREAVLKAVEHAVAAVVDVGETSGEVSENIGWEFQTVLAHLPPECVILAFPRQGNKTDALPRPIGRSLETFVDAALVARCLTVSYPARFGFAGRWYSKRHSRDLQRKLVSAVAARTGAAGQQSLWPV